jgi:hypothetical protein
MQLATPNYQFEKRQKELAKKKKQDDKRQRRTTKEDTSPSEDARQSEDVGAGDSSS